jgi:hypothetical protein
MKQLKVQILVFIVLMFVPGSVFSEWNITTLDTDAGYGQTYLAQDSSGYPHILYSGASNLKYTYQDGSGWHSEIVASDVSGGSMALDDSGFPHIAYTVWSSPNTDIIYTWKDSGGWHPTTIISGSGVGMNAYIDLDSSGYPHIAFRYYDTSAEARIDYYDGVTWQSEIAASEFYMESTMAFALDNADYGHVIYVAAAGTHYMTYAYENISGWHQESLDNRAALQYAMTFDTSNITHVVYSDETNSNAFSLSHRTGGTWQTEVIDASGTGMGYSSIFIDSLNHIHVCYQGGTSTTDLYYATSSGRAWTIETVDSGWTGRGCSMVLNTDNQPRVSYMDVSPSALKYASRYILNIPAMTPAGIFFLGLVMSFFCFRKAKRK